MKILVSIILMIATLAVYMQVVNHEFIFYDDPDYITENTNIHYGITLQSISWAFTTFHASNWHPLTWLSHLLDVQLYGLNPAGHHVTNVVFHGATTILLFLFLTRVSGYLWRSAVVAALFALHPLHVESVAWAAERKDVLSAFFWMVTLILYNRYVEQPGKVRYGLAVISMALGLMAKPMLVTLPIVLLFLDYWPLGRTGLVPAPVNIPRQQRSLRFLLLEKVPFAALAAISCVMTIYAQRSVMTDIDATPLFARIANGVVAYLLYLHKMVIPWHLSVLYQFNDDLPLWQSLGAVILLTAVSALIWQQRRQRPYLIVGWLWYLLTLVPVIGIVKVGSQGMADRYTYIPLIGMFVLLVWLSADSLRQWDKNVLIRSTAAALMLTVCAATAWRQVSYWRDTKTLFTHALTVSLNNFMAYYCLGLVSDMAGQSAEALEYYRKTIAIAPWYSEPYLKIGESLQLAGKTDEAQQMFDKAVALEPGSFSAQTGRASFLASINRMEDAVAGYLQALSLNPGSAEAYSNLAVAYQKMNRLDAAAEQYARALRINPYFAVAHANLGVILAARDKYDEAISHYLAALNADPQSYSVRHNLGMLYQKLRRGDEAIEQYRQALRINASLPETHNNLGVALAEKGDTAVARRHFELAIKLRPEYAEARRNLEYALKGTSP